jgi:hypothetical protein
MFNTIPYETLIAFIEKYIETEILWTNSIFE